MEQLLLGTFCIAVIVTAILFLVGQNQGPPRREWSVLSPSARVPLGVRTYDSAIKLAAKMGKVSHVDRDYGLIFIDTHLGGPAPETDHR